MEYVHFVPQMLNDGLQYILPMCREIIPPLLPFALGVAELFILVDITIKKVREWIVGEAPIYKHYGEYNDWDL